MNLLLSAFLGRNMARYPYLVGVGIGIDTNDGGVILAQK